MSEPNWMDPPSHGNGRIFGVWVKLLLPLVARPGSWALVRESGTQQGVSGPASNLKRGALRMPPGDFQFLTRKLAPGKFGLFARYMGPRKLHQLTKEIKK